jgi:hypothetical protein
MLGRVLPGWMDECFLSVVLSNVLSDLMHLHMCISEYDFGCICACVYVCVCVYVRTESELTGNICEGVSLSSHSSRIGNSRTSTSSVLAVSRW